MTRSAMLTHCQALTQSCSYTEGSAHTCTHTHMHVHVHTPGPCVTVCRCRAACSRDHGQRVGFQEGRGTVARRADGETLQGCQTRTHTHTHTGPSTKYCSSCCLPSQSVMNMMHVISIPYALMKVNPLSWIQKVCQFKGDMFNPQVLFSFFYC